MFLKSPKQFLIVYSFFYITFSNCFFDNCLIDLVTKNNLIFMGAATLKNVKASSIQVFGEARGIDVTADEINVAGSAFFQNIIAEKMEAMGASELEGGNINLFNGSGFTSLKKMNIHKAVIAGACAIVSSEIDSLQISGVASIDCSEIKESCVFSADTTINNSTIEGSITIPSALGYNSRTLKKSLIFNGPSTSENPTVNIIDFYHDSKGGTTINIVYGGIKPKPEVGSVSPILTLSGTTHVKGDIVFESGTGKVYKGPNALVSGKIIGAEVFNQ
jgi:hypothetical protein